LISKKPVNSKQKAFIVKVATQMLAVRLKFSFLSPDELGIVIALKQNNTKKPHCATRKGFCNAVSFWSC
jgi:hypothetical protein